MSLRTAAQQALEALEIGHDSAQAEAEQYHRSMAGYRRLKHIAMDVAVQQIADAITALRTALAEPEQEPTEIPKGWIPLRIEWEPGYPEDVAFGPPYLMNRLKKWLDKHFANLTAPQRTEPDHFRDATKKVEQRQEPVQEPVAWSVLDKRTGKHWYTHESKYTAEWHAKEYSHREPDGSPSMVVTPLYTHPVPQPVELTDDDLEDIAIAARKGNLTDLRNAIERAHGIRGEA